MSGACIEPGPVSLKKMNAGAATKSAISAMLINGITAPPFPPLMHRCASSQSKAALEEECSYPYAECKTRNAQKRIEVAACQAQTILSGHPKNTNDAIITKAENKPEKRR